MSVKLTTTKSGRIELEFSESVMLDDGLTFDNLEALDDELRDILAVRYRAFKVKFDPEGSDTDNEGDET